MIYKIENKEIETKEDFYSYLYLAAQKLVKDNTEYYVKHYTGFEGPQYIHDGTRLAAVNRLYLDFKKEVDKEGEILVDDFLFTIKEKVESEDDPELEMSDE